MEEELILVKPSMEHEKQAINFIDEVEKVDLDENIRYSGMSSLQEYKNNYGEWLNKLEIYSKKETIPDGKVVDNTFFTVRKRDNKIVGIISIRHELNEYLYNFGGHIGYSILPSERRKGYAYKQLLLGLEFCKKINLKRVLITCIDYNIGSSKTIEKVGGELENIIYNPQKEENFKRYWISLKKRYADKTSKLIGVEKIEQKIKSINEEDFVGDIYLDYFKQVSKPYILDNGTCMMDTNYKWLEFYDYNAKVKLTAMYDENDNIVEWYFDIARKIGKENGIPYEDDFYLDVLLLPDGEVILLDEEEFEEAYKRKEMTKQEYDEAYKIAKELMQKIKGKQKGIKQFTDKYLEKIL